MKKVILLIICIISISIAYGQKVQLKKGKILVDKKEKYEFLKTKDGKMLKGILPNFVLKEIDGKELLIFTDTILNYVQLPNESRERRAHGTFVCTDAQNQKTTIIGMPKALKARKYYMKELKKLDFFKSGELTSELYDSFVEAQDLETVQNWVTHIDSTNTNRLKNYELTKSKFGELTKRKPGRVSIREGAIRDGLNEVGKFKRSKKGSYAHTYEIINNEGNTIATAALFVNENRGNTRTLIDEKRKWVYYKKNKDGTDPSDDVKLKQLAEHLILQGYL